MSMTCPNHGKFTNKDLLELNIVAGLCPFCGEELMSNKMVKELTKPDCWDLKTA